MKKIILTASAILLIICTLTALVSCGNAGMTYSDGCVNFKKCDEGYCVSGVEIDSPYDIEIPDYYDRAGSPGAVVEIADEAFLDTFWIETMVIPNTIKCIGDKAFYGCIRLEVIEYDGTKAEWVAIEKGDDWNSQTGEYIIRCHDGDLTKEKS